MSSPVVDLVLVEQFLNTLDERRFTRHGSHHTATDALLTVEALAAWLGERDLVDADAGLGGDALDAALALRTALRDALTGDDDGTRAADALAAFPLRLVPGPAEGLHLRATGAPGLDVLVEAVATGVATGRWRRLKLCASPDCRWAFYDTSRNGGGRWCSMEVCGNRHKTRSYRQRQGTR